MRQLEGLTYPPTKTKMFLSPKEEATVRRILALALILGGGVLVSYSAASATADDDQPAQWLNQPGQVDPDDPNPNQVAVTGVSPEQATYLLADKVAENLAKADAATIEEPAVPGDARSLEEIYRARAARDQGLLDQICLQLATDEVFPEPCR